MVEMLTIRALTVCAQSFLSECYKCFSCKLTQQILRSRVVAQSVVVESSVRKRHDTEGMQDYEIHERKIRHGATRRIAQARI